jgi:hypothetical protein
MQLPEDFKEFIELMNSHGVRYVMIGGYAYNLYRNPRATGDIDLMTEVTAVSFEEVEASARMMRVGETSIPVISAELLLKNKAATGQAKDQADAEELRAWLGLG